MAKSGVCVKCGFPNGKQDEQKPAQRRKENKVNPFAERGKDKFMELVAEVEDKKRKIMKAIGEDEVLMVRFKYSDDNSLKPIVVTDKSKKGDKKVMKKEVVDLVEKKVEDEDDHGVNGENMKKKAVVKMMKVEVPHAYLAAAAVIFALLFTLLLRRQYQLQKNCAIVATG